MASLNKAGKDNSMWDEGDSYEGCPKTNAHVVQIQKLL